MNGKGWWTSRTVWAIAVEAVVRIAVQVGVLPEVTGVHVFEVLMLVLAVIFRWQAQGPLTAGSTLGR